MSDLPITQAQAPPPNVLADAEAALVKGLAAVDYESKAQVGFGMGLMHMLRMLCFLSVS